MTYPKTARLANAGLVLLMTGLLVAAFVLNRNQYSMSISNAETSLVQSLEKETEKTLKQIEREEEQGFALLRTERILEADLFHVFKSTVIPGYISGLAPSISKEEADEAFEKGLEVLPKPEAFALFETAAKGPHRTQEELYQKISALFNMLETRQSPQTACFILVLLENRDDRLSPSQTVFFRSMLEERVGNLEKIEARFHELQKTAEEIDETLVRKKGPYRASHNGRTLSVRADGTALLYALEIEVSKPVVLSRSPEGIHKEIMPGLFLSIPEQMIETSKATIRKQYSTGNAILALMLLLGAGFTGGLIAASRRQRQLDDLRTEFIATVSHELRTPLSLIRLHAETLKHGRVPEEKIPDYHQTILTEAERLAGIVNNVLDFSRMERNKLQIHAGPADLSALCKHIAASFQDRLEQEGLELEQKINPGIVGKVDPLAYSQIVFNLLDNAIKYSDGSKTIRIELEVSRDWNILRVSDQGIGIPDKLKKHIFEEFVRSDDRKVTARRGSGIGLSVAKRLAEKMGGTIEVKDNEPMGSAFTVKLRNSDETAGG
jgi:signal transduction histidine kinase